LKEGISEKVQIFYVPGSGGFLTVVYLKSAAAQAAAPWLAR
jgi:hypothetical protein